jgi:hypothetical protein
MADIDPYDQSIDAVVFKYEMENAGPVWIRRGGESKRLSDEWFTLSQARAIAAELGLPVATL